MNEWTPEQLAEAMKNPDLGIQQGATSLRQTSKIEQGEALQGKEVVQQGKDNSTALKIKESDWQRTVIDYAHLKNWKVAHFRAGMTSRTYTNKKGETKNVWVTPVQADGKGFFDLVLVRPPRIMFVELKTDTGGWSNAQQDWCRTIADCAEVDSYVSWYLWRPRDWELVQKVLE